MRALSIPYNDYIRKSLGHFLLWCLLGFCVVQNAHAAEDIIFGVEASRVQKSLLNKKLSPGSRLDPKAPYIASVPNVFDLNSQAKDNQGFYHFPVAGRNLSNVTGLIAEVTFNSTTTTIYYDHIKIINDNYLDILVPSLITDVRITFILINDNPSLKSPLLSNRASSTIIGLKYTEICDNLIDDDLDGRIDCKDSDCFEDPYCAISSQPEICDNAVDDDKDSLIDCQDPDCAAFPACLPPVVEICNNQIDDDKDSLIDCQDPDCASAPNCIISAPEICTNGVDDDGDGRIDCGDPDCAGKIGGPAGQVCELSTEISCNDNFDNDADGALDCADSNCAPKPECVLPPDPGNTVGILELDKPNSNEFVLHGTLPLPEGVYSGGGHDPIPFKVADADGSLVKAQVETVTRSSKGGIQIAEIIAHVKNKPETSPGSGVVQYAIVFDPYLDMPVTTTGTDFLGTVKGLPSDVITKILQDPSSITIRTTDINGNTYAANVFQGVAKKSKGGNANDSLREVEFFSKLLPETIVGPSPLPHMMYVHTFVGTKTAEKSVSLGMRFSNSAAGLSGKPEDATFNNMFFNNLEFCVNDSYRLMMDVNDFYFDPNPKQKGSKVCYDVVRSIGNGQFHMMDAMANFIREAVIHPIGEDAQARALLNGEGLGFNIAGKAPSGNDLYSWWNLQTQNYYMWGAPMPHFNFIGKSAIKSSSKNDMNYIEGLLEDGKCHWVAAAGKCDSPKAVDNAGWAQPWGVKYGGMTSGVEIYDVDGEEPAYAATKQAYRWFGFRHRMMLDRQRSALFNGDGTAFDIAQLYAPCPNMPGVTGQLEEFTGSKPKGQVIKISSGIDQTNTVSAMGGLPYYYQLLNDKVNGLMLIDWQHFARFSTPSLVRIFLGNDSLAKQTLKMYSNIIIAERTFLPKFQGGVCDYKDMYFALHGLETTAQNLPGTGVGVGREDAWTMAYVIARFSVENDQWRSQNKNWIDRYTDSLDKGQIKCTGEWQRVNIPGWMAEDSRRINEKQFLQSAMLGALHSVYEGVDSARENSIVNQVIIAENGNKSYPAGHNGGTYTNMAVGPANDHSVVFCPDNHVWIPGVELKSGCDNCEIGNGIAMAYYLSSKYGVGNPQDYKNRIYQLWGNLNNLQNVYKNTEGLNHFLIAPLRLMQEDAGQW